MSKQTPPRYRFAAEQIEECLKLTTLLAVAEALSDTARAKINEYGEKTVREFVAKLPSGVIRKISLTDYNFWFSVDSLTVVYPDGTIAVIEDGPTETPGYDLIEWARKDSNIAWTPKGWARHRKRFTELLEFLRWWSDLAVFETTDRDETPYVIEFE